MLEKDNNKFCLCSYVAIVPTQSAELQDLLCKKKNRFHGTTVWKTNKFPVTQFFRQIKVGFFSLVKSSLSREEYNMSFITKQSTIKRKEKEKLTLFRQINIPIIKELISRKLFDR